MLRKKAFHNTPLSFSCRNLSTASLCCFLDLDKVKSSGYDLWQSQPQEGISDKIRTRQLLFEPLANHRSFPMRLNIWKILVLPVVITSHLLTTRCSQYRESCLFAEAGGVSPNNSTILLGRKEVTFLSFRIFLKFCLSNTSSL